MHDEFSRRVGVVKSVDFSVFPLLSRESRAGELTGPQFLHVSALAAHGDCGVQFVSGLAPCRGVVWAPSLICV